MYIITFAQNTQLAISYSEDALSGISHYLVFVPAEQIWWFPIEFSAALSSSKQMLTGRRFYFPPDFLER